MRAHTDTQSWFTEDEHEVFRADPWLRVSAATITAPNGATFEHYAVTLPPAAVALVIADGAVLMQHRHRHVPDVFGWELPGGLVDQGETPAEAAARETCEETGWRPRGAPRAELPPVEPLPGMLRAPVHAFRWTDAEMVHNGPTDRQDGAAVAWLPLERIPALAAGGRLLGTGTLVPLLAYLAHAW